MEVTREQLRPLPLGEEGWIDLGGDDKVRIRVEYMTQAEDSEYRRLNRLHMYDLSEPDDAHPEEFFLLSVVKEFRSEIDIMVREEDENHVVKRTPFQLPVTSRGSRHKMEDPVNLISILKVLGLYDLALIKARSVLLFRDIDKKKHSSLPTVSSAEDPASPSSPEQTG